jgi:hypothetical protein
LGKTDGWKRRIRNPLGPYVTRLRKNLKYLEGETMSSSDIRPFETAPEAAGARGHTRAAIVAAEASRDARQVAEAMLSVLDSANPSDDAFSCIVGLASRAEACAKRRKGLP